LTILYLGLHFLKVTIPRPLCFQGDEPIYDDDKAKWDAFISAVKKDLVVIERTYGVDCSEGAFLLLREDTWIHCFGSTIACPQ
jgi:hypothetical protein